MAKVQRSAVSLRIISEDLDPDEITRLLGATPAHTQIKGEKIVGKNTGYIKIAKFGMWQLWASDREPGDLNDQIQEILSQTTSDLAVWRSIAQKHRIDLFCGLFLRDINEGMTLSPESLAALGERGIDLALDIYSAR
jgi:Domain of unknown function (DUF4279)